MNSTTRLRLLIYLASLCIMVATPLVVQSQENDPISKGGVHEDYDKFKDTTLVSIGPQRVKVPDSSKVRELWFTVMFSYPGHVPQKPLGFTIGLAIIADDRLLSSYGEQRLIVLAGGKRVSYDTMTLADTKIGPGGVFQQLSVFLPFYVLREIAEAKLVEAQVGPIELQLTDANLRDIRELVRRATP